MTKTERQIGEVALPIPEPKDLPRFWVFRGWHKATHFPGWWASLTWEKRDCPPMGQQISISLWELEKLGPKQRVKLIQERMAQVFAETEASLMALGWIDFNKPILANPQVWQGGVPLEQL